MKRSLTISCVVHAVALLCAVIAISGQPIQTPPADAMPVDFISATDFTQMTQGVKNAPKPKVADVKPLADKIGDLKPVKQLAAKVADKPEITTDSSAAAHDKAQAKAAEKPQKTKTPDLKLDQIADLLKKDEAKKPAKPQEKSAQQKPAHESPKFDANQVAELLDKREPQRQVATAASLNEVASLGDASGQAAQLSQSEIDALRARLSQCWNPPAGVDVNSRIYVVLRALFKEDGSLSAEPVVVEGTPSPLGPALAESAKRALLLCQPFTMLRPEHYDQWKDIELKFDPHEMLGG